MFMVRGAFGYGCYSEVVVWAKDAEDALAVVREEAVEDPDLYESYTRFPEDITVTDWGLPSRGVVIATGANI